MIPSRNRIATYRGSRGFTLIELMIALTIALFLTIALVLIFSSTSRSQREFKKFDDLVDSGRFAIQAVTEELAHAGYWGGHVPQFDNLQYSLAPVDVPTAVPNPCAPYTTWTAQDRVNLIGIPVQVGDVLPTGAGCTTLPSAKAGSDVVVVRNLERCLPGTANCEADVAGRLYMQVSACAAETRAGTAQSADSTRIVLGSNASTVDGIYAGMMLRIVSGVGAGQVRWISGYEGSIRRATVKPAWGVVPDATSTYSFDYTIGATSWPLHARACLGTGTPATLPITSGPLTPKRRYMSDIYYIAETPLPERPSEKVPALVRSQFDLTGSTLAQQPPVTLVEGVEALRVELGIDDVSDTGAAVDLSAALDWVDDQHLVSPLNRGDGVADHYVRCTTAAPCSTATLSNVVAAKLYVLIRAREMSPGFSNTSTYCLGEPTASGSCPTENTLGPFNDGYVRHVFSRAVRIINVSGRRETP